MAAVVTATFGTPTSPGFGDADVGGTFEYNSDDILSVSGGRALMTFSTGIARKAFLLQPDQADSETTIKVRTSLDDEYAACAVFARVSGTTGSGSSVGAEDCYAAFLNFEDNGTVTGYITIFTDGSEGSSLVGVSSQGTYAADEDWWIKFRVEGTALKLKIWKDGTSEPGTWGGETTDATLTSGGFGFMCYNGGGSAKVVSFDDYGVDDLVSSTEHALAGTVAGAGTTAGVLRLAQPVAGSSAGVATAAAAVRLAGALLGSAAGSADLAGAVTLAVALGGSAAGRATLVAALTGGTADSGSDSHFVDDCAAFFTAYDALSTDAERRELQADFLLKHGGRRVLGQVLGGMYPVRNS